MTKLKRLIIFSGVALFAILFLNLVSYVRRTEAAREKEKIEQAYYLATSQQLLIQQVSRKVSVLSIHHYFSQEQYQTQIQETIDLSNRFAEQENDLFSLITPDMRKVTIRSALDSINQTFLQISQIVRSALQNGPSKNEDYSMQVALRSYEASYLSSLQHLSNDLIVSEKRLGHKLSFLGNLMVVSLITGLILLIAVLLVPAIRLNTHTYQELKKSLEETKVSKLLLEQSELYYRQLFESNPLPMWIFDLQTLKFLEVNRRMVQHYGYSSDELSHMTVLDIRPDVEKDRFQKILAEIDDYKPYTFGRWIHQKKNGEKITVEINSHKLHYHDKDAMLVIAHDITATLELQRQLLKTKIDHQRAIAKATLAVQEKERNEIGKELHDNVNQILTSVKLHIELLDNQGKELHYKKGIEGLNTAIQEIRRLSRSLVPPTIDDMGLLYAIEALVEDINLNAKCTISFTHFNFEEQQYSTDLKLTLFRIVQEQLTNVLKHANAKNVLVKLSSHQNEVIVLIEDDGVGFDKNKKKKGIGLNNIINRADAFRGEVQIDSAPGEGCRLMVRFTVAEIPDILPII